MLFCGLFCARRGSPGAAGLAGRLALADAAPAFAGGRASDCFWSSPSCWRPSAELGASPDPEGASFDEADGPRFSSGRPLACPAGLKTEGCSCSVEAALLWKVASGGTPGPILFSDAASLGCVSVCWDGWLSGPLCLAGCGS